MIAALATIAAQTGAGQTPLTVSVPPVEYSTILPELVLIGGALVLLVSSSLIGRRPPRGFYGLFTLVVSALSLLASASLWADIVHLGPSTAISGAIAVDGFNVFFKVLVASALALGCLVAEPYLRREGLEGPEFFVLAMLSASGAMVMAAANDLIVLFLGLEILSIALYVLAGFHSRRVESREAAMKYFVLGAFSSAIFLYGIALVYGATGTTSLPGIAQFLSANLPAETGVLYAGMALLLVGFGFKIAAVPFHTWTPDVYQGSPTPVTGFMAAVAKAGGFAGLIRVFMSTFPTLRLEWKPIILVIAIATLAVGSVLAVVQRDIKRMLAYSSVSHAGYVLIGLQAASTRGVAGALFYLLAYTFMVIGSFGVVTLVGRRGDADHDLDAYRGLASRRPGLALAFTVFLMAQAGVPFTSGFLAKFYVLSAAVQSRAYALAVVGMLMAAVAAFFYLRVVILMYSPPADDAPSQPRIAIPISLGAALGVCLVFTIVVGILPSPIIEFARRATLLL